jgi:hypothetical protein
MLDYLFGYLPPVGPAAGEKELRERFASIGIGPGAKVKFQDLPPDRKAAFGDGVKAALRKIDHAADNLGEEINSWRIGGAAGSREFYNGDWLLRAAGSRAGIYGNDAAEATYPFAKLDQNGHPLDGSNAFVVCRRQRRIAQPHSVGYGEARFRRSIESGPTPDRSADRRGWEYKSELQKPKLGLGDEGFVQQIGSVYGQRSQLGVS